MTSSSSLESSLAGGVGLVERESGGRREVGRGGSIDPAERSGNERLSSGGVAGMEEERPKRRYLPSICPATRNYA